MAEQPTHLDDIAGPLHAALIADQLVEERARKSSLEQRALAIITTSGALATLLIGLAAFVRQASKNPLGDPARYFLVAAAGGFIVAAVLALLIIAPREYEEALPSALDERTKRVRWSSTDVVEEARTNAVILYHTLVKARELNGGKATLLFSAVIAEVVAVLASGVAASITVLSS